jgi:glucose-1-phosphate thymidylyltransferase
MKGILLAGGKGSRLAPITTAVSKQLLPVYDKPMIYYPLSVLILAGIREILVISTPQDLPAFRRLLGDGRQWGLHFQFAAQPEPRGIADALLIGREFIAQAPVCLILGDNIFYGGGLHGILHNAGKLEHGAQIFAYQVKEPARYGVVLFDDRQQVIGLEEKPRHTRSQYAVPGIYFYDGQASALAATLQPSARGELEITDLNNEYLRRDQLRVQVVSRGVAWLDAGTHESLLQSANFVQAIQDRQGLMICSPEEVAYRQGYITRPQLQALAEAIPNDYGAYLHRLATEAAPR